MSVNERSNDCSSSRHIYHYIRLFWLYECVCISDENLIHTQTHTHTCMHTYTCIYSVCSESWMHTHMHTHTCIYTYSACSVYIVYVMRVWYKYIYIHTNACIHVHVYKHVHVFIHTHVDTCIHTYIHTYIHTVHAATVLLSAAGMLPTQAQQRRGRGRAR